MACREFVIGHNEDIAAAEIAVAAQFDEIVLFHAAREARTWPHDGIADLVSAAEAAVEMGGPDWVRREMVLRLQRLTRELEG